MEWLYQWKMTLILLYIRNKFWSDNFMLILTRKVAFNVWGNRMLDKKQFSNNASSNSLLCSLSSGNYKWFITMVSFVIFSADLFLISRENMRGAFSFFSRVEEKWSGCTKFAQPQRYWFDHIFEYASVDLENIFHLNILILLTSLMFKRFPMCNNTVVSHWVTLVYYVSGVITDLLLNSTRDNCYCLA